jgi:hypothetical protein
MQMTTKDDAKRDEGSTTRRKQRGGSAMTGQRLAVPEAMLDHSRFQYRWVNDDVGAARMFALTKEDDWDIVAKGGNVCETADLGDAVSRIVGKAPDGSALRAYLCRKPKSLYDEDQAAKSAQLDRELGDLRRGKDRTGSSEFDYIPASGIRVG